jgi:hypothetical protein
MRNRGLGVALLAASAAVMVGGLRPVAASHINEDVRFLEFNFCGIAKDDACGGDYSLDPNGQPVDPNALPYYHPALANRITLFKPQVVVINEICSDQLVLLKNDLASREPASVRWTFQGEYFLEQEIDNRCAGADHKFGNAILTRNEFEDSPGPADWWLRSPGVDPDEPRRMICQTTKVGTIPLAVCAAKMSGPDLLAKPEIEAAMDNAFEYSNLGSPKALFFAGDFNVVPSEDDPFDQIYYYDGGNFQEMDQCPKPPGRDGGPPANPGCNRYTHIEQDDPNHKNKIDYMFFKQAWAKDYKPAAPDNVASSDHHIYWGTADICHASNC